MALLSVCLLLQVGSENRFNTGNRNMAAADNSRQAEASNKVPVLLTRVSTQTIFSRKYQNHTFINYSKVTTTVWFIPLKVKTYAVCRK